MPFQHLAQGRVVVLMTTRKDFIIEAFGEHLAQLRLRPMEDATAERLIQLSSGKSLDELHGPSLKKLVKICAGLAAMLRSVGKMCGKKSAEATVRYFEEQKLSHRLPEHMARADGYQQEAAKGNLFLAYQ